MAGDKQFLTIGERIRKENYLGVSVFAMKALKYLSFVGKIAGLVSALNVIPFVDPKVGLIVFAAASILKDAVNRIGDLMDDGRPNQSFKA